jgi:hypothetical protein
MALDVMPGCAALAAAADAAAGEDGRFARVSEAGQCTRPVAHGQVYRCDLGYGLRPWLVVSNNARNRLLDDIIAIRLTTTARDLPTWVKQRMHRPVRPGQARDMRHESAGFRGSGL